VFQWIMDVRRACRDRGLLSFLRMLLLVSKEADGR
jgi:hypothetical protein